MRKRDFIKIIIKAIDKHRIIKLNIKLTTGEIETRILTPCLIGYDSTTSPGLFVYGIEIGSHSSLSYYPKQISSIELTKRCFSGKKRKILYHLKRETIIKSISNLEMVYHPAEHIEINFDKEDKKSKL